MGVGLRWQIPQWLVGALVGAWDGQVTAPLQDSRAAVAVIHRLRAALTLGLEQRRIQAFPHPIVRGVVGHAGVRMREHDRIALQGGRDAAQTGEASN